MIEHVTGSTFFGLIQIRSLEFCFEDSESLIRSIYAGVAKCNLEKIDQSKWRQTPTKMQNRTHNLTSFTAFSRLNCNPRVNFQLLEIYLKVKLDETKLSLVYSNPIPSLGFIGTFVFPFLFKNSGGFLPLPSKYFDTARF